MVADHHSDRRIDELGRNAILLLVRNAELGVPAALPQVFEGDAVCRDLRRILAGGGHQPHRNWRPHTIDDESIANLVDPLDARRAITEFGINVINIAMRRFGDVRIRGYRLLDHWRSPSVVFGFKGATFNLTIPDHKSSLAAQPESR